ncbi:2-dehydropantoate 2-reductase [Sodalis-like endosymbiont of Proechinophthirus fluctus]|uniref:2-dehydropantoate 2-reductase n=1 Tax=Sodalis-like endosymbiont of Proechinophthirus fluctus TaxID=1462730 RepID=UPI0007A7FDF4|nr:2-dehydropantoate 2-reductase [Sodalis-like endosymbiont of Proechinophthirus fluctus]KYP95593.1 2-dehydropantoate 2-reductase [Sodalis-like endosymbiont of Proechinophthirus fluctus]
MKITVLGCGALGQLWLVALSRQGHSVQGWLQVPQSVCAVDVISPQGQESRLQLPANNTAHLAASDLLLVTLKARQVSAAVRALLPQLQADCAILLLHNGLGTREELPVLVQPLIMGTTTHAAHREEDKIHHVYAGTTRIGPGNSQAQQASAIAQVLNQALPEVTWHNNITASSWVKLTANCVINPLTAIYDCCNGELESHVAEIEAICREVAMVMDREGYHTHYESLLFYVSQVIRSTTDNISSMLQDVRAQRHSEIDYINGYVLRRARAHRLSVPENQRLFDLVKRKEESYGQNDSALSDRW